MNAPKRHPRDLGRNTLTPFARVLPILSPRGNRREILAAFKNAVSWSAVRHWRAGRAKPPQWVVDQLRERAALLMAVEPHNSGAKLMAWLAANGGHGPGRPKKEKAPAKGPS